MPRLLRHLPTSGSTTTRDRPCGACLSNRIRFGTTVDANRKQRPWARNYREPEMEAEHTLVPRTMFSTTPFGVTTSMVEASSFADEIFVCRSNVVLVTGQPREGPGRSITAARRCTRDTKRSCGPSVLFLPVPAWTHALNTARMCAHIICIMTKASLAGCIHGVGETPQHAARLCVCRPVRGAPGRASTSTICPS